MRTGETQRAFVAPLSTEPVAGPFGFLFLGVPLTLGKRLFRPRFRVRGERLPLCARTIPYCGEASREAVDGSSPALIARGIPRAGSEPGFTRDALAGRLAARPFVEKAMDMLKHAPNGTSGADFCDGERLRANSIPLALIGFGLAWLIARESHLVENLPAEEWIGGLRRRITPSKEAEILSGRTAGEVATGISAFARTTGERISNYAGVAGEGASRLGSETRAAVERHPFLFGALGLVSGAALATLLPTGKRGRNGKEAGPSTGG